MTDCIAAFATTGNQAEAEKIAAALVDGRFRVACALRLLEFIGDDSIVIIHDFWFRAGPKYTQKVAQGDSGYGISGPLRRSGAQ